MSGLLLDTHVWFWFLTASPKLPKGLKRKIEDSTANCWLSPVSVWELGMLAARGRVSLEPTLREWVGRALQSFPQREAPLTYEVALASREIVLPHRDPADHLIAATAVVNGLVLATVDEALVAAKSVPTISR